MSWWMNLVIGWSIGGSGGIWVIVVAVEMDNRCQAAVVMDKENFVLEVSCTNKRTKPTVLTTQTPTLGQLPINIKPHTYCQYQARQLTTDLCQVILLCRVAGLQLGTYRGAAAVQSRCQ